MADDFIDKMLAESVNRYGAELTPEQAAERFALHNFNARVEHLGNIRKDDSMTLNEARKRYVYEKALKEKHRQLRALGR